MSAKDVERIENIARGDIGLGPSRNKSNRTLKRVRKWQRRIWRAGRDS